MWEAFTFIRDGERYARRAVAGGKYDRWFLAGWL